MVNMYLRNAALLLGITVSTAMCSSGYSDVYLGDHRFRIPARYILHDTAVLLAPPAAHLDQQQAECLIELSASDLGLGGESGNPPQGGKLIVRLSFPAPDLEVAPAVRDAWLGTGLYAKRVVEEDAAANLIRVYPEAGHPVLWSYFKESPVEGNRTSLPISQVWVAACTLSPATTEFGVENANCQTTLRWNGILVEVSFPGYFIHEIGKLREAVFAKLAEWSLNPAQ